MHIILLRRLSLIFTSQHFSPVVFEDRYNTQLILEETDEKSGMELRGTVQVSNALSVLRGIYSVIAVFMGSFLFILGLNILLFLFIHLVSVSNTQGIGIADFVASLFSVPVFVYSLAFAMTLVTNFVADTFYGNRFLRSSGLGVVITEWTAFVFYLGVPFLAFIVTLFSKKPNWWEISLLTWFASVLTFWGFFSACVFYFEITHCLKIQRDRRGEKGVTEQMGWCEKARYWLGIAKDATKCTMRIRLSGTETKYKKQKDGEKPEYGDKHNACPVGLFSLLTMNLPCYKQFDEEEQKKEIRSLGEVLGLTTYVTRYSWSLDKLFCRSKNQTSSIFLTSGEARVGEDQIKSSIACRAIGNVLICLLVLGALVWMGGYDLNLTAVILIALLLAAVLAYVAYHTAYLKEILRDTSDQSGTTWTRFWEVRRINEPSDRFVSVAFLNPPHLILHCSNLIQFLSILLRFGSVSWQRFFCFISGPCKSKHSSCDSSSSFHTQPNICSEFPSPCNRIRNLQFSSLFLDCFQLLDTT